MPSSVREMLAEANAAVPRLDPAEVRNRMNRGDVLIVDVRDALELAAGGKLKGAIHVSRGMLEFRADPESPYHNPAFQKDKTVLVYCASGGRSALSGKVLKDFGYQSVYNGVVALLWPALGIRIGFVIDAAVFASLLLTLDWLPLRLRIAPASVKHSQARRLAHREFAVRIAGASHHRNGVLFFVSLGERYVEVIADRDIHSRVASDTWDRLVADFIAAVKAGRLAQGFIAAVETCGDILETHYPDAANS